MSLKIGILAAGITPDDLLPEFGSYADMFKRLFRQAGFSFDYLTFDVRDNDFPASARDCDAWVVTGSKANVYEDLPWMRRLKSLILEIYNADLPTVGICFGHQIIAEAFGGDVNKDPKGWGVGLHRYEMVPGGGPGAGMTGFTLSAMHQDQVLVKPDSAKVLAYSPFCPFAALQYDDRILTFQAHPEFDVTFETRLVKYLSGKSVPEEKADQALEGLEQPAAATDSIAIAQWMAGFLQRENSPRHMPASAKSC
ncbi:glutamine amidotransferase-related protein [Marinobacter sp.]|uniref:glutamine amidotransferase-related protein n=1 Tax=Marinobacter sp. TaxID=50741 RepID=UPI003A8CA209